jgi:predicted ATP-grasp superfamily ATP-dependent carboligase
VPALRILLYEFVCGGGLYSMGVEPPSASLAKEAAAMLSALAADFVRIDGVSTDVLVDVRHRDLKLPGCTIHPVDSFATEGDLLARLAPLADWTIVVAPEFDGQLLSRCLAVEGACGRLLGCNSRLAMLASDKHATAEHLSGRGVPVAPGIALAAGDRLPVDFQYPAVLKPRYGAGSQGIRLIVDSSGIERPVDIASRLERYMEGTAVSVAALCGPPGGDFSGIATLVPCRQFIDNGADFAYSGGLLPIEPELAQRAKRLATCALATLAEPLGYLGVDMVLGRDPSGAGDAVIEINPRLTTSYVGLRILARGNLAEAMMELAAGRRVELSWRPGSIQFQSSGGVQWVEMGSL